MSFRFPPLITARKESGLQRDMEGFGNFMESKTGKNCIYMTHINMLSSLIPKCFVFRRQTLIG